MSAQSATSKQSPRLASATTARRKRELSTALSPAPKKLKQKQHGLKQQGRATETLAATNANAQRHPHSPHKSKRKCTVAADADGSLAAHAPDPKKRR